MEIRRLYYENPLQKTFTATVTGCEETKGGYAVTLDATAFYPEGGGQPCDFGTLGGARVTAVKSQDEQVVHICDAPLEAGATVAGEIDFERRFDLMQQHSGEHIVSGIIHQLFGYHNVGFHMGEQFVTIDFDGMLTQDDLQKVELLANQAVWQDLQVNCFYPSQEELPNAVYRSKRALPWPVRLVEIPGYDTCACCGVHVKTTGQIGMIKLLSVVKFHQGVRIEMACGGRALSYLNAIYQQNRLVSQAFSAKLLETGEAAQAMNKQLSAEKYRSAGLENLHWDQIAQGFADQGNVIYFPDIVPTSLKEVAQRIASRCGGIAAVLSGNDEEGYKICLMHKENDVTAAGKALCEAFGGKGGGKGNFFQGSVKATRQTLEDAVNLPEL